MEIIRFLLLFVLTMSQSEEAQKKYIYNESNIIEDSEIRYSEILHPIIWKEQGEETPFKFNP